MARSFLFRQQRSRWDPPPIYGLEYRSRCEMVVIDAPRRSGSKLKNKLVFIFPIIGFGWCDIDSRLPVDENLKAIETPLPFHARLLQLDYFAGRIIGGRGMIEDLNHPWSKQSVAFCIRDRGEDLYDLDTNPGKFNVRVGKGNPVIKVDRDVPMPNWMKFSSPSRVASGFGFIAATEQLIRSKYSWLPKE
jgi:hypothetical protein